ncbi:hypothetical protein PG990_008857 [Apiospora arundinis]
MSNNTLYYSGEPPISQDSTLKWDKSRAVKEKKRHRAYIRAERDKKTRLFDPSSLLEEYPTEPDFSVQASERVQNIRPTGQHVHRDQDQTDLAFSPTEKKGTLAKVSGKPIMLHRFGKLALLGRAVTSCERKA